MNGYDKEEALRFILKRINRREHAELSEILDSLIAQAIDADIAFMHETGVLDADSNAGDAYYEEDDAFEYIVERLAEQNSFTPEEAVKAASLVDDYMDFQQEYLESKGLVDWDDA